jgi:peptide/nickel transport system substrate-binding protein
MQRARRPGALVALTALAVVAAACGGDNKGGSSTTTASSGAATTTATTAGTATTTAGSTAAPGNLVSYDESAKCGTADYKGELAKIQAVDAQTVKFTLCTPDVAFPSKVAFAAFEIYPSEYLDKTQGGGDLIDKPVGTGPYKLQTWDRGNQIVLTRNDDYWGTKAKAKTAVFQWNTEAAQRLVQLQSGAADAIDNVGTDDFDKIKGDSSLQLVDRPALNIFYVGFNRDIKPFDNELVRQAVGYAIDKQRIVDNFYPKGSTVATQFLPAAIPGAVKDFTGFTYDQAKAKDLLAQAGFPNGFEVTLSYRDVVRPYLPQPAVVAQDLQDQLGKVGIKVNLDKQESGTFIDNANGGKLPFYLLGWGADYPDATNFFDYHFGKTGTPQFGAGFPDIQDAIAKGATQTDDAQRAATYADVAKLLVQHAPMIPVANGGSAVAYKKAVTGAQASPLSNELLYQMGIAGQDQLTFVQNGEPAGLYCADETDGEALRICAQVNEPLLEYEANGTKTVPALAESFTSSPDLKEWTFKLRSGVKFTDGSTFDANDVVRSYRVQWDAKDPDHKGRTGDYLYFSTLFGGFLNPPPAKS